jgi:hypothetical protein
VNETKSFGNKLASPQRMCSKRVRRLFALNAFSEIFRLLSSNCPFVTLFSCKALPKASYALWMRIDGVSRSGPNAWVE